MTDVDDLREALRSRPAEPLPELDIRQIMVTGGRMRRRRRIRIGTLSAATLAAVLAVGVSLQPGGGTTEIEPARAPEPTVAATPAPTPEPTPASWPAPTPVSTSTSGPTATATAGPNRAAPEISPPATPGDAIGSVTAAQSRSLPAQVLYLVSQDDSGSSETVSLVSGRRRGDTLTADVRLSAPDGPDRTPGFLAFHPAAGDRPGLSFGYYRGPVRSIRATDPGGTSVEARRVRWNVDPEVVIFWFTPEDLAADPQAPQLSATRADGTDVSIDWADLGEVHLGS